MVKVFGSAVALTVLLTGMAMAAGAPKDQAKPACQPMAWQAKAKFSTLHGAEDKVRFSGYGNYETARQMVESTLFVLNSPTGPYLKLPQVEQGLRQAAQSCGDAVKYQRLIDVVLKAEAPCFNMDDRVVAIRAGIDFLLHGRATSMTKDILTIGLAMTQPAMSSTMSAAQMLEVAIREASLEAQQENQQFAAILAFTRSGTESLYNWQSKFAVLERVARNIVEAPEGVTVFLRVLYEIAAMPLDSFFDQYQIVVRGLRTYGQNVPSKSHQAVTAYLVGIDEIVMNKQGLVQLYKAALEKFQNLSFDAPAAKVLLQVGLDLSGMNGPDAYTAGRMLRLAMDRVCQLDVPDHIRGQLRAGIQGFDSGFGGFDQKLMMLRSCAQSLL